MEKVSKSQQFSFVADLFHCNVSIQDRELLLFIYVYNYIFGLASVYPLSDLSIRYKVHFPHSREAGESVSI